MTPEPRPADSDRAPQPRGQLHARTHSPPPPLLGTVGETSSGAGYLPLPKLFSLPLELFIAIAEFLPVGALFRLNRSSRQLYPALQHLLAAAFLEHLDHILSWAIEHNDPHLLTRVLPNRSCLEEHEMIRIIILKHAALIPPVLHAFPERITPTKNGWWLLPLFHAASCGSLDCMVALMDGGHSPGDRDSRGRVMLSQAIERGDVPVVEALLRGGKPKPAGSLGDTPLHYAIWGCSPIFVGILLRAGALTDVPGRKESTPMLADMCVACSGCLETRRALIAAGVRRMSSSVVKEGEDWRGDTMLWAVKFSKRLVQVCVEAGWVGPCVEGWATPLQIAARHGKVQAAITLLEAGEDVDELGDGLDTGTTGWAPLHESTGSHFSSNMIDLLIEKGAKLDVLGGVSMDGKDRDVPGGGKGLTPLQLARERGNMAAVEKLEACGARL